MLLHQTCYILKNLPSCYNVLSSFESTLYQGVIIFLIYYFLSLQTITITHSHSLVLVLSHLF